MRFKPTADRKSRTFHLAGKAPKSRAATVACKDQGRFLYVSLSAEHDAGECEFNRCHQLKIEVDLQEGRYNLFINDRLAADFVPLNPSRLISPTADYRLYSYERYSRVIGKDDMGGKQFKTQNLRLFLKTNGLLIVFS